MASLSGLILILASLNVCMSQPSRTLRNALRMLLPQCLVWSSLLVSGELRGLKQIFQSLPATVAPFHSAHQVHLARREPCEAQQQLWQLHRELHCMLIR